MREETRAHLRDNIWAVVGLGGWSAILFWLHADGALAAFLHPAFRPPALAAAWGLLILALILLLLRKDSPACCSCESHHHHGHDHEEEHHDHGHGHSHSDAFVPGWKLLVLLVPAFGALLIEPGVYSAETVRRRGNFEDPLALSTPVTTSKILGLTYADLDFLDHADKTESGAWLLEIPDILHAMEQEGLRARLMEGRVETVVQRMETRNHNASGKRLLAYRLVMACCAADARPIGILAEFPQGIPPGSDAAWLKIQGHMAWPVEAGRHIPVLVVDSCEETTQPEEPFLY